MILTSYFGKLRFLREQGYEPVSIARSMPRGVSVPEYRLLAPSAELLRAYKRGEIDDEQYRKIYSKYLLTLDADRIAAELEGKVLLCWEGPDKFCHRHIVARWLNWAGHYCYEL